jgi:AraC family transcriptional regulator
MTESPARALEDSLPRGTADSGLPVSHFWSRADGKLHVQWYRASSQVEFAPHTHSEFNIVVCLEGAVLTRQFGEAETAEAGQAMMGSNPGVEHSSRYLPGRQGCQAVSLTFAPEVLSALLRAHSRPATRPGYVPAFAGKVSSRTIERAAQEIAEELRNRAFAYEPIIEGLAMRILVESFRLWPKERSGEIPEDTTPRLARRDHVRACEFMRWCRKDSFRIQRLCRFLGTSEERFNRLFRATTNDSPASFYNRLLMDQGCALLEDPALSVKEISYQLGFKTPSHFVVTFRRQFGATPQDYRYSRITKLLR